MQPPEYILLQNNVVIRCCYLNVQFRSEAGEDTRQSSDVSTPQGVPMKNLHPVENDDIGRLAERAEQPSPISVLDNVHFQEEECTPSPGTEKTVSLPGQNC